MPRNRFITALVFGLLFIVSHVYAAPAVNWTWVWAGGDAKTPDTVFFRQKFVLPAKPVSARLRIVADDKFTVYFNGQKKPFASASDWTTVQEYDAVGALKAGENLFAVEAVNLEGPGGLLYKLVVTLPKKKTLVFFSDARVRSNRRPPPGWTEIALDDSKWPAAREIAPAGSGTWGTLRGAPQTDPTRLVRLWDIRAGADKPAADPYTRTRSIGDRMLLTTSVGSASEMQILAGAGFTLFQSDSDHLSTEETALNQWDWHTPEAQRRTVQRLGLDWCYFPHYAFPPDWFRKQNEYTRLQCLEHEEPVAAFSVWDPNWTAFIGKGYDALAQQFTAKGKPTVSALNVGVHGDYGEAGLLSGARILVPAQREDWQKRFGNTHDHLGFWCADPLARADFRAVMLKKYGSLEALNVAWKREFKTPDDIKYPAVPRAEARSEWLDFIDWYQNSVGNAIETNLAAARKHFPDTLLMLPAGFSDEDIRGGNDNSLIPKLAAKYGAQVRSTHSAFHPFAENAATMFGRLGSACRFYDVPFWTEPPSGLTEEQETERLFEAVSQGARGTFDWADNALAHRDVYYRYGKYLRVEKPIVDAAMFYPAEAQKLRPNQGYAPLFAQACAYLRDTCNFDIVDDRMVMDGALARYRVLALWEGTLADGATLEKIKAWVNEGGVLLAYDFGKVTTFDGNTDWYAEMFGYAQEVAPARITERYPGDVPAQYRFAMGGKETADFLSGDWYDPLLTDGGLLRWTGATANLRLPVRPDRKYTLTVRATVPPEAEGHRHRILLNGHELGSLDSPGDITYHFPLPAEFLNEQTLATLTLKSETFVPAESSPESKDKRKLGLLVQFVQLVEQNAKERDDAPAPAGTIRRELDLHLLKTNWARRYGKGLTVYFNANRSLLKGYIEVIRQVVYHLSDIEEGRRDALPIDNAQDGVYATLFTDKILFYNSRETPVTKVLTIPAETWDAWKGEVAIPLETTLKITLEPHGIGAIDLAPQPQEMLFECEEFKTLNGLSPRADARCSPGSGPTCVHLVGGASIATRFKVETPGQFTLYTRTVRNNILEPVDILLDGLLLPAPVRAGQTFANGSVALTKGTHILTLKARLKHDVNADFVLFTNDPTIRGYDFAIRNAPVE